ncbi:hypothetical protein [Nocardia brasiliensis]|uniref:hypothetical protein n=1 Tax=Nocardia brasiliensis TaxID=37326 RepID=UPI0024558737|nr:hypothetical protein [Nocardia brasiliensis]
MASRTRFLIATAFLAAVILVACGVLYAVRHTGEADAAHVCPEDAASSDPGWMSSNTDVDAAFDEHPFVGNGYLGLRVPPRGSGYALTGEPSGWPLYTPRYDGAFVAGLYGHTPGLADDREVAAALPNWSTLTVGAGDDTFSTATPAAQITKFAQTRYLRCGLVRTTLTWTGRDGKVTDLVYEVLADRAPPPRGGGPRAGVGPRCGGGTLTAPHGCHRAPPPPPPPPGGPGPADRGAALVRRTHRDRPPRRRGSAQAHPRRRRRARRRDRRRFPHRGHRRSRRGRLGAAHRASRATRTGP